MPLMTALGEDNPFKLIHDTFQHLISGDNDYFEEHIATVQISDVSDPTVFLDEAQMRKSFEYIERRLAE
ncbi:hypothetical protein [Enterovibrio paralichthyis]|uniref:hypothetical protein n=1 Tax=Enterovibrio paralichthyis TaxID=2853805 RepID=UPI001C4532ED|nr:hypothetical protein [Enterovibrio paralichthyis]MBV7296966.1 hypothetical protein [Enterovibrio paralichthyis]